MKDYTSGTAIIRIILAMFALLEAASPLLVSQFNSANATNTVLQPLCGVYKTITTVIFILGLTVLILGAVLYAGANVAPSQAKGAIQGYGIGMIIGGIVGGVIALLAPFILQLITGNAQIASICASF